MAAAIATSAAAAAAVSAADSAAEASDDNMDDRSPSSPHPQPEKPRVRDTSRALRGEFKLNFTDLDENHVDINDLFNLSKEDADPRSRFDVMARIVQKYCAPDLTRSKKKKSKKKSAQNEDEYDLDDPFLDDGDAMEDVDESCKTKHAGFYINFGDIDWQSDSSQHSEDEFATSQRPQSSSTQPKAAAAAAAAAAPGTKQAKAPRKIKPKPVATDAAAAGGVTQTPSTSTSTNTNPSVPAATAAAAAADAPQSAAKKPRLSQSKEAAPASPAPAPSHPALLTDNQAKQTSTATAAAAPGPSSPGAATDTAGTTKVVTTVKRQPRDKDISVLPPHLANMVTDLEVLGSKAIIKKNRMPSTMIDILQKFAEQTQDKYQELWPTIARMLSASVKEEVKPRTFLQKMKKVLPEKKTQNTGGAVAGNANDGDSGDDERDDTNDVSQLSQFSVSQDSLAPDAASATAVSPSPSAAATASSSALPVQSGPAAASSPYFAAALQQTAVLNKKANASIDVVEDSDEEDDVLLSNGRT